MVSPTSCPLLNNSTLLPASASPVIVGVLSLVTLPSTSDSFNSVGTSVCVSKVKEKFVVFNRFPELSSACNIRVREPSVREPLLICSNLFLSKENKPSDFKESEISIKS